MHSWIPYAQSLVWLMVCSFPHWSFRTSLTSNMKSRAIAWSGSFVDFAAAVGAFLSGTLCITPSIVRALWSCRNRGVVAGVQTAMDMKIMINGHMKQTGMPMDGKQALLPSRVPLAPMKTPTTGDTRWATLHLSHCPFCCGRAMTTKAQVLPCNLSGVFYRTYDAYHDAEALCLECIVIMISGRWLLPRAPCSAQLFKSFTSKHCRGFRQLSKSSQHKYQFLPTDAEAGA